MMNRQLLKEKIQERNIRLIELAEATHISYATIKRFFREGHNPSLAVLVPVFSYLELTQEEVGQIVLFQPKKGVSHGN